VMIMDYGDLDQYPEAWRHWSRSITFAAYRWTVHQVGRELAGGRVGRPTIRGTGHSTAVRRERCDGRPSSAGSPWPFRNPHEDFHQCGGFTYVGPPRPVSSWVWLWRVGVVWPTQAQREREEELLFIGHALNARSPRITGGRQYPRNRRPARRKRGPEPRHICVGSTTTHDGRQTGTSFESICWGLPGSPAVPQPRSEGGFNTNEDAFKDATATAFGVRVSSAHPLPARRRGPKAAD